jgi:exopolysaccharide biosynthesis operon protein EpsL
MLASLSAGSSYVPVFYMVTMLSLGVGSACAETGNPLDLRAVLNSQVDSNLFRQSAASANHAVEQVSTATLGLGFNTQQSLQSFGLNLSMVDVHYPNFSYLNYTASNYDAAWQFAITPGVRGSLSSSRQETLNSYADVQNNTTRFLNTNRTSRLDARYGTDGPWSISTGLTQALQSSQRDQVLGSDFSSVASDLGLHHQFRSGSKASITTRVSAGQYLNPPAGISTFFDNNFSQLENEAGLHWALGEGKTADIHIAQRSVTHPHVPLRDFSGTVTGAEVNWALTGKIVMLVAWSQTLDTYQTLDANYSRTERVSLGFDWQMHNKLALSLRTDYSNVSYLGGPLPYLQSQRRDNTSNSSVALTWRPRKQCTLSASVQSAARASNTPGLDYASTLTSLTAQVNF